MPNEDERLKDTHLVVRKNLFSFFLKISVNIDGVYFNSNNVKKCIE